MATDIPHVTYLFYRNPLESASKSVNALRGNLSLSTIYPKINASQSRAVYASPGECRRCRSKRWRCSARGMLAGWVVCCCCYHRREHSVAPLCTSYCSSRPSVMSAWNDCWATWSVLLGLPNRWRGCQQLLRGNSDYPCISSPFYRRSNLQLGQQVPF